MNGLLAGGVGFFLIILNANCLYHDCRDVESFHEGRATGSGGVI